MRELGLRATSRGEREFRSGRDIVNDLQHRPAFVRAAGPFPNHVHRGEVIERIGRTGEVARADVRPRPAEQVEAVRNDPDGYSCGSRSSSIEAEEAVHLVRLLSLHTLTRDRADIQDRSVGGLNGLHAAQGRRRCERCNRKRARDHIPRLSERAEAEGFEVGSGRGGVAGRKHIDDHRAVGNLEQRVEWNVRIGAEAGVGRKDLEVAVEQSEVVSGTSQRSREVLLRHENRREVHGCGSGDRAIFEPLNMEGGSPHGPWPRITGSEPANPSNERKRRPHGRHLVRCSSVKRTRLGRPV